MFVFVKNDSVGSKNCKVKVSLFKLFLYVDAEKGWISHWFLEYGASCKLPNSIGEWSMFNLISISFVSRPCTPISVSLKRKPACQILSIAFCTLRKLTSLMPPGVSSLNEFSDTPILVFCKIMPFKPELLRYKHVKKNLGTSLNVAVSVFINFAETGEKKHWSKTVSAEKTFHPVFRQRKYNIPFFTSL